MYFKRLWFLNARGHDLQICWHLFLYKTILYLFQDDISSRPRMAGKIGQLANYSAAIQTGPSDSDAKAPEKANLGTLMGVYLPCIQNIFGVILFIRMTWIVGTAGAVQGFFVVFLACTVVSFYSHFSDTHPLYSIIILCTTHRGLQL